MLSFLKIQDKDLFLLNKDLLCLPEAELWIGAADGPVDNDDARVMRERWEHEKIKDTPGVRPFGISAVAVSESSEFPGWFEVNTAQWPVGIYRFNLHSKSNVQSPVAPPLNPNVRDQEYSWAQYGNLTQYRSEQQQFFYRERNGQGFCLRIEITADREIKPAGDGPQWIKDSSSFTKH